MKGKERNADQKLKRFKKLPRRFSFRTEDLFTITQYVQLAPTSNLPACRSLIEKHKHATVTCARYKTQKAPREISLMLLLCLSFRAMKAAAVFVAIANNITTTRSIIKTATVWNLTSSRTFSAARMVCQSFLLCHSRRTTAGKHCASAATRNACGNH